MKRILSIVMTLVLLWGLTMPAAAEAAVGTTLRLEKTEGTVTVESASGKSLSLRNGMRLYSGTKIKTSEGSYAYISLDSGKAVKLDASSESEVRKSGKKLELNLLSGELFFDVTVPLEKDESLNIRTSTMVTGVRGTSGYAVVYDCYHSEIVLLEGHLTVHKTHGSTGGSMVEINGGEKAIAAPLREEQNDQIQLTVESVKEESVPGFVAVEVKDDLNLQDRIDKNSPLSVPKIIGDAQQRLEADEKQAAEAAKETQKKLDEQKKEEEKSKPDQMFESKGENVGGGGGGGSSKPPAPSEVTLTGSINSADLAAALARANKVILDGKAELTVNENVEIPAGKTVTMQNGAKATVETDKTMAVTGTMNMENGSSLTNNGEFAINSTNSLHLGGTFTNKGELSVGTVDGSKAGLLKLNAGGELTNRSHVNVYAGSTLRNAGTIESTGVVAVWGGGSMDNTGTYGMTGGKLDLSATASLTNSGTFNMGGGVLNSDGVDLTNSGTFNMDGNTLGTVDLIGAKLVNTGTFNMTSGTFKSTGTALVNQGTATISGGTMSGSGCVIDTSASEGLTLQSGEHPPVVMLEDEAELKPGETKPDETKPCVIRGQFTWKDGSLKAKSTYYFPNYHGGPAEIENRGNDGYIATFAGDVRNLTWREFSRLQDALNISHVKTVNLDLAGSDFGMELNNGLTIPANKTLNLKNGGLIVPAGKKLTNNGTITSGGTLVNAADATLTNNGTITLSGGQLLNLGGVENGMNHSLTLENGATIQNGGKQASDTPVTFTNQGTLTIERGCTFKNTGSFTNEGTCTNGGTFNHNGTGSNDEKFINNGTFDCAAEFTNNGTFENGANAACNVGATFTNNGTFENKESATCTINEQTGRFNNDGTFVNENTRFEPGKTFYTKGKYQETFTRNVLMAMETSLGDGQVLRFVTLNNWGNWNNNTKVTLYGGDSSYGLNGVDTAAFRTVAADITAALDLNGQHLKLGDKFISVAGTLTLLDSAGGGTIKSDNKDGAIQLAEGGKCDVQEGITISSPTEPPATKTESGKTSAAASAQKPDASLTPTPEPGAGEGAKTKTETGEHADAKPEEKVEEESAAAQGTGSEQ